MKKTLLATLLFGLFSTGCFYAVRQDPYYVENRVVYSTPIYYPMQNRTVYIYRDNRTQNNFHYHERTMIRHRQETRYVERTREQRRNVYKSKFVQQERQRSRSKR